ncbi:MAG: TetR family transcriptional regulator [Rhodospirillales bacterium]|jgi:AcrR family transcriptional regulator|nr:TetR family transcriptional regulator [Rhodospirillales bacterium]
MPNEKAVRARIVAAAFKIAATDGWSRASLGRIAVAAKVPVAELHGHFPTKAAIIDAFMGGIDQAVLADGPADADDCVRDRLFEVLMLRFDALAPHKAGVAAVLRECCDPTVGLIGLPCFLRSMAWMVEAAGLSSSGIWGVARVNGLALIYANAVRVWLRDDTPDIAKTMAALDRGLRRADGVMAFFCRDDSRAPE